MTRTGDAGLRVAVLHTAWQTKAAVRSAGSGFPGTDMPFSVAGGGPGVAGEGRHVRRGTAAQGLHSLAATGPRAS